MGEPTGELKSPILLNLSLRAANSELISIKVTRSERSHLKDSVRAFCCYDASGCAIEHICFYAVFGMWIKI